MRTSIGGSAIIPAVAFVAAVSAGCGSGAEKVKGIYQLKGDRDIVWMELKEDGTGSAWDVKHMDLYDDWTFMLGGDALTGAFY